MARPRTFDETQVLDHAMEKFWAQGYEATSIDDLVTSTGLSRSSIYQAFGSKHGLFDAAVEHYTTSRIGGMLGGLEGDTAGLDDIVGPFDTLARIAAEYPDRSALGCLLTNSMTEMGNTDPEFLPIASGYVDRLRAAFANALGNATEAGAVEPDIIASRSELLATLALGAFVRVRGTHSGADQQAIADAIRAQVDDWRS